MNHQITKDGPCRVLQIANIDMDPTHTADHAMRQRADILGLYRHNLVDDERFKRHTDAGYWARHYQTGQDTDIETGCLDEHTVDVGHFIGQLDICKNRVPAIDSVRIDETLFKCGGYHPDRGDYGWTISETARNAAPFYVHAHDVLGLSVQPIEPYPVVPAQDLMNYLGALTEAGAPWDTFWLDMNWTAIDDQAPREGGKGNARDAYYQRIYSELARMVDTVRFVYGKTFGMIVGSGIQSRHFPHTDQGFYDSTISHWERFRTAVPADRVDALAIQSWEDDTAGTGARDWPSPDIHARLESALRPGLRGVS